MGIWLLGNSPLVWAQGAGSLTVTTCLPCHRGAAGEPGPPTFPTLDGQHAAYLDKQLREYKSGKRKSAIKAPLIGILRKQQIPVMAAHFASQTPARGAVENPQLAAVGKVLYEEGNHATGVPGCVGCHLPNGVGFQRYPRLAGQRQAYIVQQLLEFKSGARSNDRAHVMRAVAGRLTDEEIRAVAEYLAGLQ
jgi:cytochrome c553